MLALKDQKREIQQYIKRASFAFLCIIFATLLLLSRLAFLQVYHYDKYATLSKNNSVRMLPIPPVRGLIYDSQGNLLAENIPGYSLNVIPEQTKDLKKTLEKLQILLMLSPDELTRFEKKRKQAKVFSSIPLRDRLSEEDMAKFSLHLADFPGVEINAQLIRHYPYKELFAHSVGYVGRISEQEVNQLDPAIYQATLYIGKTGIEKYYEAQLHGKPGFKHIEIDAHGRMIRVLGETPPISGKNLTLTLELPLQQQAFKAMNHNDAPIAGAIVGLDPKTGAVLTMISSPTFDPNVFAQGIPNSVYQQLEHHSNRALFNRVIQGQYPPASTIKPFLSIAGLEQKVITPQYAIDDHGVYQLTEDGREYRDWRPQGHGRTNLHKAIRESCDTYFYGLAHQMGIDSIASWLHEFGFGKPTHVDLPGEKIGVVPSRTWKRKMHGTSWYQGETLSTGIGQGYTLVTPLQLASSLAIIINNGTPIIPHLLKERSFAPIQKSKLVVAPEHWKIVKNAMEAVIKDPQGTAHRLFSKNNFSMAGKTGTAQIFTIKQKESYNQDEVAAHLRDHTLFIGFAPVSNPKIAVATILEHNKGGADIARDIIEGYLLNHAS